MDVPRSKIFDDIYFSAEDGRAETQHVFIDANNLPQRFAEKEVFTICETGFGTGLNFLLAWESFEASGTDGRMHFISFEKYPLDKEEIATALQPYFEQERLQQYLSVYPQNCAGIHEINVTEDIYLSLIFGDVNEEIPKLNASIDAWFLDGFAPAKNPEMWSQTLFENMARLSETETTFATFTAAGIVRRGLAENGFNVEKISGYGRKRDMIKGSYHG